MERWDQRFLALADHIASWSKDPSTKVGAVIVRQDRTIASVGYNGFPRGVDDCPTKLEDRGHKYPRTVHAELNAILNAREPLHGYTLYVSPLAPCAPCAAAIIQAGIGRVVGRYTSQETPRWQESNSIAGEMFLQASVQMSYRG